MHLLRNALCQQVRILLQARAPSGSRNYVNSSIEMRAAKLPTNSSKLDALQELQ
jgi:hypothetical protein